MGKYIIQGGKTLSGVLPVSGAKNATLPILACTLIAEGTYFLNNVPALKDVEVMIKLLEHFGLKIEKIAQNSYKIINNGLQTLEAPYELVSIMRASFLVMGPLLAHRGEARVSMPGGCAIGNRPIDIHLKGFEQLGATIKTEHGLISAKAKNLIGKEIYLDFPTVTGTENLIMAAVLSKGITILNNAAREPEVEDLGNFLNKMGAKITGLGTDRIIIEGVEKLFPCEYNIILDRIEAGTFLILSALTGGNIVVKGVNMEHLTSFKTKLEEIGINFKINGDEVQVQANLNNFKPTNIITLPYPGFPTDLQAQTIVLLAMIKGNSEMKETIFENRFRHVPELNRMGANIKIEGNVASINGPTNFQGAEVEATDLRAGACLVIAGLISSNTTILNNIEHIERGYENLVERLQAVGAEIKKSE